MIEIGLKLWSSNTGTYLEQAKQLYEQKIIDYVELYVVPGSTKSISVWQNSKFPYVIHCAHSMHKFNLSFQDSMAHNRLLFDEAIQYFKALGAHAIIVHPGVLGTVETTTAQLNMLLDEHDLHGELVFVENKPAITLTGSKTVGSSPVEIKRILDECNVGFVLDVTHAIKYAIKTQVEWTTVLRDFMAFSPQMLHVSDGHMDEPHDEHLHIGSADFDFEEIFRICKTERVSIETKKDSTENLNDFKIDVQTLKEYLP